MSTSRIPIYIGFDSTNTPSGLNVFGVGDTIPIYNGGTGVTSFADLNLHCSTLGATSSVSATYVSSTYITASAFNGVPYPPPFSYVVMDAAGTNTTNEQNFSTGAAVTTTESKTYASSGSNDITWDDNNKYFNVSSAGTYEIFGYFLIDSAGQSDPVEITSTKNGSDVHIVSPKQYGATGPNENTFHSVLTAAAGDYITVTIHMDDGGTKTAHLESGSNLMLRRIL